MTVLPWPIAVTQWTLGEPSYERALNRIAAAGYRSIELAADPDGPRGSQLDRMLTDAGLTVTSLCPVYSPERDAAHPDPEHRRRASDYLRRCLELGGELGARALVLVPTYRVQALALRNDEIQWAAETVARALSPGAVGPLIVIEALNRYETHLVNTLSCATDLCSMIADDRVKIMADLYHMNIEERSLVVSLCAHAENLAHVHLADSNRSYPGAGHLAFTLIGQALHSISFTGTMSMEFTPAGDAALRAGLCHVTSAFAPYVC